MTFNLTIPNIVSLSAGPSLHLWSLDNFSFFLVKGGGGVPKNYLLRDSVTYYLLFFSETKMSSFFQDLRKSNCTLITNKHACQHSSFSEKTQIWHGIFVQNLHQGCLILWCWVKENRIIILILYLHKSYMFTDWELMSQAACACWILGPGIVAWKLNTICHLQFY